MKLGVNTFRKFGRLSCRAACVVWLNRLHSLQGDRNLVGWDLACCERNHSMYCLSELETGFDQGQLCHWDIVLTDIVARCKRREKQRASG